MLLVAPKAVIEDGEGVAEGIETRSMLTFTEALEVRSVEVSVTVHFATPVSVCPEVRLDAVKVVEFAEAELIVIPVPPESHTQA